MDKVSVIIPTYNNPEELERAVMSVLQQTYDNIEIIIIDDGSKVSYVNVIENLKSHSKFPIIYLKKRNEGPGKARQHGLNFASGKYFQYLDSDDEILPDKIRMQVEILRKNPDVVMTYGLSCLNGNFKVIHRPKHLKRPIDDLLISTLQKRKWHTSSCLWHYPLNTYWEDLTNGEDVLHDFNVALKVGRKIIFTPQFVSNITFSESEKHLSNSIKVPSRKTKLKRDNIELNTRMLSRIKEFDLMKSPSISSPLTERFFYVSLSLASQGYVNEAKLLLEKCKQYTPSTFKKAEIFISFFFMNHFHSYPQAFRTIFRIHRAVVSPNLHQYRYI